MKRKRLRAEELDSILYLLGDQDPVTRRIVASKFLELDWQDLSYLFTHMDGIVPDRDRTAVSHALEDSSSVLALKELAALVSASDAQYVPDGMYLLTRMAQPRLAPSDFNDLYENIGISLVEELRDGMTAVEKTEMLNHVFFSRCGFRLVHDGDNGTDVLLTNILENKKGGEIGLSSAYFLIARYAGLPIYPLFPKTPGYFVCWFEDGRSLFTMDVSNEGRISDSVPESMWKITASMGNDTSIYYVYAASVRYMGAPLPERRALLFDRALDFLRI